MLNHEQTYDRFIERKNRALKVAKKRQEELAAKKRASEKAAEMKMKDREAAKEQKQSSHHPSNSNMIICISVRKNARRSKYPNN